MAHRAPAFTLTFVLAAALLATGCDAPGFKSKTAKSPSEAVSPKPASVGDATTTSAGIARGARPDIAQIPAVYTPGLSVSDAIAQACGIQPRGATTAPSFEYDSAALAEEDREMLAELARCLSEGALEDERVVLIGRADARGEAEYNMTLGGSRADAVHRYLVDLGVGRDRVRSTSRGEMDATGTTEDGWAHDRRVDIELAP